MTILKYILNRIFHRDSRKNLQNKAGLISKNIIQSASECILYKFITCICDKNYKVLIKKGSATEEELKKAWAKIYDEYLTIVSDREQSYIMQLSKEIYLLEFKINQINLCVTYLSIDPDPEVLKELKRLVPVSGKFNIGDEQKYLADLQLVVNQSRRLIFDLESKTKELEDLIPKEKTNITRTHFDKLIVHVSKYMKFQVSKFTTSVAEFATMMADMRMMNEYLINQQNAK